MVGQNIKIRLGVLAGTLIAMVIGFRAMIFDHLPGVFAAPEEDLSFGWYVPLFSLYVLWTERRRLLASLGAPAPGALAGIVAFLLMGFLGVRGIQVRFELLSFIGLLIVVPWALFGRETAKRVLFPALFLLFCMPLASYLALVTVPLRLFVSTVSAAVLSGVGLEIVRQGNMLALPGVLDNGAPFVVNIADPCSGLRSVFALMALAAGYGYFIQPTWLRRGLLFALSIPLAILGNILRIMAICLAAKGMSPQAAMGPVHDAMGFVVFLVALGLLIAVGALLDRLGGRAATASAAAAVAPAVAAPGAARLVPALVLALLVPAMAYLSFAPAPTVAAAPDGSLPAAVELGGSLVGVPLAPSVAETNLLVGAQLARRVYLRAADEAAYRETVEALARLEPDWQRLNEQLQAAELSTGERQRLMAETCRLQEKAGRLWATGDRLSVFTASSVVSGPNKASLHRPELCLPSQGYDLGAHREIMVDGLPWQLIELAERDGRGAALFAYTFINQEGYRTNSHAARIWRDVWDRSVHNRIDRWVMITVTVNGRDEAVLRAALSALKEVGR